MNFRSCKVSEAKWLAHFYKKIGYGGTFRGQDNLYFVEEDEQILGVVRIALENDIQVLRGMQVLDIHRGSGIGTKLLQYLDEYFTNEPVYCIPYKRLVNFYGSIGFNELIKTQPQNF